MTDAAATPAELPDDAAALKALVGEKSAQLRARDLRIAVLEEELQLLRHKRFGSSSEKADPDQLGLFNEAEEIAQSAPADTASEITVPEHTRKKSGRNINDLGSERIAA